MAVFSSQINWRGMGTIAVVELLVLFALALAVITYVDSSSDNALQLAAAPGSAASDGSQSSLSASGQSGTGQTGCPRGKKPLPTQLMPLP